MTAAPRPKPYPALVRELFARLFAAPSWFAWGVWLKAAFALRMTDDERAIFSACTGRTATPSAPCREAWTIASRRSGKSRLAGFIVVCLAVLKRYKLAPGEKPVVLVIGPTLRQTNVVLGYVDAILDMVPGVTVVRRTQDTIELSNGVSIQAQVASFRSLRGYSIVGAVLDEVAFFRDESGADSDVEILRAIRPALASVPGSLLVAISSPYAQRGELHRTYEKHFGRDGSDVLVWKSETRRMNPTIPQQLVDQAMEEDPASAAAEWGGEFRSDLETLFTKAALDAVVARGRFEIPPASGRAYVAFLDPSGGSSDSFTLAIAHRDVGSGTPVLDMMREVKPPFSPEQVVRQFAADILRYRCTQIFADSYAALWPVEQFQKAGVTVAPSPLTRSELYLETLPLVNSGGVELLDNPKLLSQLQQLERRTGRTGKDAIDHPRGGHDDVANAACGALVMTVQAVGLRAQLPLEFSTCNNFGVADGRCAFWMTSPWFPNDRQCRDHCPGLRAVLPAFQQHRREAEAAGETPLSGLQFLRERYEPNPMMSRALHHRAEQALGLV